jgi:hypothetical protein
MASLHQGLSIAMLKSQTDGQNTPPKLATLAEMAASHWELSVGLPVHTFQADLGLALLRSFAVLSREIQMASVPYQSRLVKPLGGHLAAT